MLKHPTCSCSNHFSIMKDNLLYSNHPEDPGPSCTCDGDSVQFGCTDIKGKQKVGMGSAASRLEASRKLVVNAITTSRDIPTFATEFKTPSGPGYLDSSWNIAGEPSSHEVHQPTSFEQSRKTANECQNDVFDTFTKCSCSTDANDGVPLGVFDSSFIDQERLDGSAVLELLSQPENESDEPTSSQESKEDRFWTEAVDRKFKEQQGVERLDFVPDFITRPESFQQAVPYLGTGDIQETRSTWFGYWNDVFTSYNARVWGTWQLTTLGISGQYKFHHDSGESTTITKALNRLKLIFYHLKKD
ncbi:hypothetical protein V8C37DRAFT_397555 [Trichoderma ceciliae]